MASEPDSLVLQLLREMRANMATKEDLAAVRSEFKSDIADVASDVHDVRSDMNGMRKDLGDQNRRAASGGHRVSHLCRRHGILINELEARLRRVEQHLSNNPIDTH